MKRIRLVALLSATLGLIAYLGKQPPIYAAEPTPSARTVEAQQVTPTMDKEGVQSYATHCAICHGEQREGILPAFPPLLGIGRQMTNQQIVDLIHSGKGRMPAFPKLQSTELTALVHYLASGDISTSKAPGNSGAANIGNALFQRHCAFCHGRDAAGGETGPDLTRSKLVITDDDGDKISEVVRNGRPEKKMPAFNFSEDEMASVISFIKAQEAKASAQKGNRRGVDVSDLQTGSVEAGRQYFNGPGTCSTCHSATGDLAGIASRYQGLQLEERMLYPRNAKSRVTVTLPSGQKVTGELAYLDEFTVGLRDNEGTYRSWATTNVKYTRDSPVHAHVDLFSKYTDADIHNLMAYLQTMR